MNFEVRQEHRTILEISSKLKWDHMVPDISDLWGIPSVVIPLTAHYLAQPPHQRGQHCNATEPTGFYPSKRSIVLCSPRDQLIFALESYISQSASGTEGLRIASAKQQGMSCVTVSALIRTLQLSLNSNPGSREEIWLAEWNSKKRCLPPGH